MKYKIITSACFVIFQLLISFARAEDPNQYLLKDPYVAPNIQFGDDRNINNSLSDYRGKVILLNFWATWCAPCLEEMPALLELSKAMASKNLVILPIAVDFKGVAVVQQFYKENNLKGLPVLVDHSGKAFKDFKLKALPTSFIIDRKGNVVAKILGAPDWNNDAMYKFLSNIGDAL